MRIVYRKVLLALLISFLLPVLPSLAQGIDHEFGQNRVQYHDFTWSYYQSDNFVTYFYLGGQELGRYAVEVAEQELPDIESILDYKINSRIEILVFNDISDLNQSNIGTGLDLENTGGVTKIIGNKVFVYFNGNHHDLKRQIREGIAKVLISNMIFGGSIQEVLQNAVLLNLPEWFVDGLVSYIGEDWNSELDNRLRNGILSEEYKKFNKLSGEDARFAGHSFWYYVAEVYGKESIPNLLYLTRINRSLENGFLFVLGMSYKEAVHQWYQYFHKRYIAEEKIGQTPLSELVLDIRQRKNRHYYNPVISPDGKYVAYISNILGRHKVHLFDIATGKDKVILMNGFKTKTLETDYGYPLIAFDPSGRTLVTIYEKRDVIQLMTYDVQEQKKQETLDVLKFQRIVDISFTNDPRKLVISAINRGQSDIYYYNIQSKSVTQITNDIYDDLQPEWVDLGNRQGIVFVSNRPDDTLRITKSDSILPNGTFDIFLYKENAPNANVLVNLTNTPLVNEKQPMQIGSTHFAYLSDKSGIYNRYAGYVDSIFDRYQYVIYYKDSIVVDPIGDLDSVLINNSAYIDSIQELELYKDTAFTFTASDYIRNIQYQKILPRQKKVLELIEYNGDYNFYITKVPEDLSSSSFPDLTKTTYRKRSDAIKKIEAAAEPEKEKKEKINPGFTFQNEFIEGDSLPSRQLSTTNEDDKTFISTKVLPYRVKFSTDYVLSQLDNGNIITEYQHFIGNGPVYNQPPLSGLITLSLSDLFENHRFTGGFRIPTSFAGSEYFFAYTNRTKRLDKKFLYYRKVEMNSYNFSPVYFQDVLAKQKTNYFETSLTYPIDVLRSIRAKFGIRNYKIEFLAADQFTLDLENYYEDWISGRLEYVFDNTLPVSLNILNGTRYKVYYEVQNQFDLKIDPGVEFDPHVGILHILGGDFRHYQKIHKNIIWANRIAGATSFGNKRLIYYLGGVDNWLFPKFNQDTKVNMEGNYAFQTLALNMRGFQQNIRNGNSYALINSEIRIPVFTYLFNAPIRSGIIRNFQLVAFGDIGTAWEGTSPYDEDNPFNSETISNNNNIDVTVRYFRNPIVGGYGLGARTVLFGYFIRGDVAWGVDSGIVQDPQWYFSLGLDF